LAYTRLFEDAAEGRIFFKKTLGSRSADAGEGWLILAVPAAEVAFHPHDENNKHEMYFMCDDIEARVAALKKRAYKLVKFLNSDGEPSRQCRFLVEVPSVYMNRNSVTFEAKGNPLPWRPPGLPRS